MDMPYFTLNNLISSLSRVLLLALLVVVVLCGQADLPHPNGSSVFINDDFIYSEDDS